MNVSVSQMAAAPEPDGRYDAVRWTLPHVLRHRAASRGESCFLRQAEGEALTYRETLDRSERIAAGLAGLGVGKGDRVLLLGPNSLDYLLSWFAVNLLGAAEVPVNTALRGASLVHVVRNSGARIIVAHAAFLPTLAEIAGEVPALADIVVWGSAPDEPALPWRRSRAEDFLRIPGNIPPVEIAARDLGAIMYTSGTTGPAKGVRMSHAHLYLFAYQMVEALRMTRDDIYLVTLPLFHANAQLMQVYASMIAGGEAYVCDRFSASGWLGEVRRSGATVSSLLGVTAQFVFSQPPTPHDADHALRRMITIPMPAEIGAHFEKRFNVRCIDAYGMTEICVPVHAPYDEPLVPGSCGKPASKWFDVRIVDPQSDRPLPPGEVGEIVVRPRHPWTLMMGYHEMPERTVEAWRNLWFHTGDAGRCDAEGNFYYADRLRDRIRRRGENISSFEIEAVALRHPQVREAAAVGVPAAEGDEDILLCIAADAGSPLDCARLLDLISGQVPYFAVPRYVALLPELPKTPSGKVLKTRLRDMGVTQETWDREKAAYVLRR